MFEGARTVSVANYSATKVILLVLLGGLLSLEQVKCQIFIGSFPSFAHGLQGDVFILNDRQIAVRGFSYDGQAPSTWFMGMKNGTRGIYSADGVALPGPSGTCENMDRPARNIDIVLTLPYRLRVYDLEALSLYCYRFCHNFGHVRIPRNIRIPPAPNNLPGLQQCYPRYTLCGTRQVP